MPAKVRQNLYPGVNAHLQNLLPMQGSELPSSWPPFHSDHITYLTAALNEQLPDNYMAVTEQSLQIRSWEFITGKLAPHRPQPDSTIYQLASQQPVPVADAAVAEPVWEATLDDLAVSRMLPSVIIRRVDEHDLHGDAVTRIELLSPSNKPDGSDFGAYFSNRVKALKSETALVEIDYFHRSPTPLVVIMDLPAYPDDDTYPYNTAVSVPRGGQIQTRLYGFGVDDPMPRIPIPLAGDETLPFDFNTVYQQTYYAGRWGNYVDYSHPLTEDVLATYRADDQARLELLRQRILQEVP